MDLISLGWLFYMREMGKLKWNVDYIVEFMIFYVMICKKKMIKNFEILFCICVNKLIRKFIVRIIFLEEGM